MSYRKVAYSSWNGTGKRRLAGFQIGEAADIGIDVGGFRGIGAKPVRVPIGDLNIMRDGDGKVFCVTMWTKDQRKAMPRYQN